ncbi:MAG TPA: hypothetical protein VKS78_05660 [Roseiarcus sp.]|nr:hypothetical protein [Roseiarcus sp.]
MDHNLTSLERAFQLAKSGQVAGLDDIRAVLKREGYSADQVQGRQLARQLKELIKAARSAANGASGA